MQAQLVIWSPGEENYGPYQRRLRPNHCCPHHYCGFWEQLRAVGAPTGSSLRQPGLGGLRAGDENADEAREVPRYQ